MSQMLPEGEVMRRVACADVCPAPPNNNRSIENKELLRQQLLSTSKERQERQEQPKPKQTRTRQKNRWKLKFHHQALPQEYLDHYEQTLQKENAKKQEAQKKQEKPKQEQQFDFTNFTSETFKLWAQKLSGAQNETGALTVPQIPVMMANSPKTEEKKKPAIAPSKVMTYDDLPYMGEMTLNNSKPRRGRKPKKADICHLIYENYGTVVPGQPPMDRLNQINSAYKAHNPPLSSPKTDLQNKIISSLLEKKLFQENKKRLENLSPPTMTPLISIDELPTPPPTIAGPLHSDEEPLNLCIRDLHELKIQIQKKFGNIYTSMPEVKTENDEDQEPSEHNSIEQPNAISVIQRNTNLTPKSAMSSPELSTQTRNISPALSEPAQSTASPDSEGKMPGYVYWPHAGIYMHPLALQTQLLYYQRLAAAGQLPFSSEDRDKCLSTPSSISEVLTESPSEDNKSKLVLKQISELLDPNVLKQEQKSPDQSKKRASPNPLQGPVKRKRSAIFIPPVPAKTNTSTPTTEVSICKFKFTGGSKPSLQEKKMLSVDSGGNFRYYSGTGNTKGNKAFDYLQNNANAMNKEASTSFPKEQHSQHSLSKEDLSKKKRKSRKSLQREKLEQTFKEKGFLIQTQQLESAEGATYCKFRQLRKFTRYLFRSWKDYLPGELEEGQREGNPQLPVIQHPQPPPQEGAATGEWG